MTYKKLIIQQMAQDAASTYTTVGGAVDTYEAYGIVCQEFPFKYLPEKKELAKRDWLDEDGEDVYVPNVMREKAYDLEVKFLYVGNPNEMRAKITSFITFISGKNSNGSPLLAIYDEYTQIGRRCVYVNSIDSSLYEYNDGHIDGYSVFSVEFRVTDPTFDVIPVSSGEGKITSLIIS